MKKCILIVAAMAFGSAAAFAAGIDSRSYTCPGLQAVIAANRFVFINTPGYGDFAVADRSYCSMSDIIQRRTVPTTDSADCPVNYCRPPAETRGAE
jgi:hypothetical protein